MEPPRVTHNDTKTQPLNDIGSMSGLTFGDHAIQVGEFRIAVMKLDSSGSGAITRERSSLSIAHREGSTVQVCRSDGTLLQVLKSSDQNVNPWKREFGKMSGISFGERCIVIGSFLIRSVEDEGIDCLCIGHLEATTTQVLRSDGVRFQSSARFHASMADIGVMKDVSFGHKLIELGGFRIGPGCCFVDGGGEAAKLVDDSRFYIAHRAGAMVELFSTKGSVEGRGVVERAQDAAVAVLDREKLKRTSTSLVVDVLITMANNKNNDDRTTGKPPQTSSSSIATGISSTASSSNNQGPGPVVQTSGGGTGYPTTAASSNTAEALCAAAQPFISPSASSSAPRFTETLERDVSPAQQPFRLVVPRLPTRHAMPSAPPQVPFIQSTTLPKSNDKGVGFEFIPFPGASRESSSSSSSLLHSSLPPEFSIQAAAAKKKRAPRKVPGTGADRFGNAVKAKGRPLQPPSGWLASQGGGSSHTEELWQAMSKEEQRTEKHAAKGKRTKLNNPTQAIDAMKVLGDVAEEALLSADYYDDYSSSLENGT